MVLAYVELRWLTSSKCKVFKSWYPTIMLFGIRYIDDIRVFIIFDVRCYGDRLDCLHEVIETWLGCIYNVPGMEGVELEDDPDEAAGDVAARIFWLRL